MYVQNKLRNLLMMMLSRIIFLQNFYNSAFEQQVNPHNTKKVNMKSLNNEDPACKILVLERQIREVRQLYESEVANTVERNLLAIKLLRLHEKKLAILRPTNKWKGKSSAG
jgi:hypothetical protein